MERIRALEDFDAARFRAFTRAVSSILTRRARRLQSIEPVLEAAGLEGRSYGGIQEIPLDLVVGSAAPPGKNARNSWKPPATIFFWCLPTPF